MTLALLLFYSAALIGLGLWIGRRVRSAGAFFVAGRALGPGLIFATILAANIGAGSTVGAASRAWRDGFSAWWWVGSAGLGTILLGWWLGPRLWRIAKQHDLHTVGDLLELRYGAATRGAVAALLWVGTLAILGSQLMAVAWVLDVVAGIPRVWGCVLGGAVVTAYFYAGGLVTSAWVNLVQLVVLVAGFALALPFALDAVGGHTALLDLRPTDDYWGFTRGGTSGWIFAPLLVPAFLVSPGLVQKCWGAKSAHAVRRGVVAAGVALLVFSLFPTLLGMTARALHPTLDHPDLALPTLLVTDLPAWLGLLGLAAVFSAELSSADAILFMLATSLSRDLYRRFLRPEASDREILRVARVAAAVGGALGVVLALQLPDVIAGLQIFYALLGVSLLVPVIVAAHGRWADASPAGRRGTLSALTCAAVGVGTLLWARGAVVAPLTPNLVALAASAAGFAVPWFGLRSHRSRC
ncbi:MAG: sodium:solute symporter family protein [Thermoanaerobaculia bacterium]|nr:sodium:solute symporter family protein [Thermoanaerobaculia bacterium]